MTDEQLIAATIEARDVAHKTPVYTGDSVYTATRSSMRGCAVSERYMDLLTQCKTRGLTL